MKLELVIIMSLLSETLTSCGSTEFEESSEKAKVSETSEGFEEVPSATGQNDEDPQPPKESEINDLIDENSTAIIPVVISGSYLNCEISDSKEILGIDLEDFSVVKCRLENAGKKVNIESDLVQWTISGADDQYEVQTSDHIDWDMLFIVPKSSLSQIKIKVDFSNELNSSPIEIDLADIITNVEKEQDSSKNAPSEKIENLQNNSKSILDGSILTKIFKKINYHIGNGSWSRSSQKQCHHHLQKFDSLGDSQTISIVVPVGASVQSITLLGICGSQLANSVSDSIQILNAETEELINQAPLTNGKVSIDSILGEGNYLINLKSERGDDIYIKAIELQIIGEIEINSTKVSPRKRPSGKRK